MVDHLPHLEELAFHPSMSRVGMNMLVQILDGFIKSKNDTNSKGWPIDVRIKIDGSPSVLFGYEMSLGGEVLPFVATKGFFNKTPIVCFHNAELREAYGHDADLLKKMTWLFAKVEYSAKTKEIDHNVIYHGDMLEKYPVAADAEVFYSANIITYTFDRAKAVKMGLKLGDYVVAVHTTYASRNHIYYDRHSKFNVVESAQLNVLRSSIDWAFEIVNINPKFDAGSPGFQIHGIKNNAVFTDEELSRLHNDIQLWTNQTCIKSFGSPSFNDWVREKYERIRDSKVTQTAKDRYDKIILWYRLEYVKDFVDFCISIFRIVEERGSMLKYRLIERFPSELPYTDVNMGDHGEGLVIRIPGYPTFKVVNRYDFSRRNFLRERD